MRSQLLKGVLEGCILAMISRQSVYGYELSMKLQEYGLQVSEGSIYPVLLRLQKEKMIQGEMRKSESGPNRKYYYLTEKGEEALKEFSELWADLRLPIDRLLKKE